MNDDIMKSPRDTVISITGLGYVGLPLALLFATKFKVIAYDRNTFRIDQLKLNIDPSKAITAEHFVDKNIFFTANPEHLREATLHIVAVPTPIDKDQLPDLRLLKDASNTVGAILKKGDTVVFESTVYPGCTAEVCVPLLESQSGLKSGFDFNIGYSPERMNPGDTEHSVERIVKVVAGDSVSTSRFLKEIYGSVITAGICEASSIEVAEAAKVIENVQRDINIALMNELSILFHKMKIDTREVLRVAGTKWNFMKFTPGLVGGHCIGVDPYYLVYAARKSGIEPQMINYSRNINNHMPSYIAGKLVQSLTRFGKAPSQSKVLIMGVTFKENIADVRNSKVADLAHELKQFAVEVDLTDPLADPHEFEIEYGLKLIDRPGDQYHAVVVAVAHTEYKSYTVDFFTEMMDNQPILFDLKGIYPSDFSRQLHYFCL
jgi:UDP-N-acetyl-D-galactosamine dehydrogenase